MSNEEIIGGPYAIWIAPASERAPEVNEAPAGNWTLLGRRGAKNISEDGITINTPRTVDLWRSLGSTLPMKGFISEEDVSVEFAVADSRAETWAHSLAKDPATAVTTVAAGAGQIGTKSLSLYRGFSMRHVALLLRGDGQSPELAEETDVFNSQLWLPRAIQVGESSIVIVKNGPQLIGFMFQVLDDDDDEPTFLYQTDPETA